VGKEKLMAGTVKDVMTGSARVVSAGDTVLEAARAMRDASVGALLVVDGNKSVQAIVTDRDIVLRCVADGRDPATVTVSQISSSAAAAVAGDADVAIAEEMMRSRGVRRLAVTVDGRPVGVVSLDDLIVAAHPSSPAADIVAKARDAAARAAKARQAASKVTKAARGRLAARIAGPSGATGDGDPPDTGVPPAVS
jgi:signal-transduction protein with cAMP-binding, CBS, and nucleotidyltransferase domain